MTSEHLLPADNLKKKCKIKWWTKLILIGIALYGIYALFILRATLLTEDFDKTEKWRYFGDPKYRYQIYSAHVDNRTEVINSFLYLSNEVPLLGVRIMAIVPTTILSEQAFCTFRFSADKEVAVPAKEQKAFQTSVNQTFTITSFYCVLVKDLFSFSDDTDGDNNAGPELVALSSMGYENPFIDFPTTFVRINYNQPLKPLTLAVCAISISSKFQTPLRLVEFIELWKILGADHFYFYDLFAQPQMKKLLAHYSSEGVATVMNWNLKGYDFEKELCDGGNCAISNECLYRASLTNGYEYVAAVDFDQFLIPSNSSQNLKDFIKTLDQKKTQIIQFPFVNNTTAGRNDANNKNKTSSIKNKTIEATHSKYIVKGLQSLELANDHVSVLGPRDQTPDVYVVKPTEGSVFSVGDRYRAANSTIRDSILIDNRLKTYRERVAAAIEFVCADSEIIDGICPFYI